MFKVDDIFVIGDIAPIIAGHVISGNISLGFHAKIGFKGYKLIKIESNHKEVLAITKGDKAGLFLEGIKPSDVQKGMGIQFF